MPKANHVDTVGRGFRDLWLGAAYEMLVASGVDAVCIRPLGKKVALLRTSFYWFFADREALLEALLELWRDKNTGNLALPRNTVSAAERASGRGYPKGDGPGGRGRGWAPPAPALAQPDPREHPGPSL